MRLNINGVKSTRTLGGAAATAVSAGPHWLVWLLVNVVVVRHILTRAFPAAQSTAATDASLPPDFTEPSLVGAGQLPHTLVATHRNTLEQSRDDPALVMPETASWDPPSTTCGATGDDAIQHDFALASSIMEAAVPTAYENSTGCADLGPTCVQSHDFILYDPALQPRAGLYTPLDAAVVPVFAKVALLMYVVSWTGSNADTYLGNLRRYTSDVVRAWPAGTGAVPPVPFSACDAPVVIAFDFPDNVWHAMAAYTAVWHALRRGAIDDRATLAILLPHAMLSSREYLITPLQAVTRGTVTLLSRLAGDAAAAAANAEAVQELGPGEQSSQPPPLGSTADPDDFDSEPVGPFLDEDDDDGDPTVELPAQACYDSVSMCSIAGYHDRPPLGMFDFLQAVKDALLARPPNYDASSPRVREWELPPPEHPFVTSPEGVLRVLFAFRETGSRRVLNAASVLESCRSSGGVDILGARVPIVCESYEFARAEGGGMAGDVAKMQATDVLVAVHGAGLTNMGFLRPGASVIEIRPATFDSSNADRFFRPLARDSGAIKWWGVLLPQPLLTPGAMEVARAGNSDKYGRDKDVRVPWGALAAAVSSVAGLSWPAWLAVEARAFTLAEAVV